jgi:hypothetical protein
LQGNRIGPVWTECGLPSHYDLTYNSQGEEVAVGVAKTSPTTDKINGKVIMRRLNDGAITPLNVGGFASHTSTRNYIREGWAYVSHMQHMQFGPKWPPYQDEVFAVKLDGSLTVQRYAHIHSAGSKTYYAESQAIPSPDGKRILFASTWGESETPVQAYVVDLRLLCQ